MRIIDFIDQKMVCLAYKADKVLVLSSATNALTLIFKGVIYATEKCISKPVFLNRFKIIVYIKAKDVKECFNLLLPYYGNKWVQESKKAFDLKTCINDPLCLNFDAFAHYQNDWPFLANLINDKKFDDFKNVPHLGKVECLKVDCLTKEERKVEILHNLFTVDPSLIDKKFIFTLGLNNSTAMAVLKKINLPNDPLRDNIDLIVKLFKIINDYKGSTEELKKLWMESINCLINRDDLFFSHFFPKINEDLILTFLKRKPALFQQLPIDLKTPGFIIYWFYAASSDILKYVNRVEPEFIKELFNEAAKLEKHHYYLFSRIEKQLLKLLTRFPLKNFFEAVDLFLGEKKFESSLFHTYLHAIRLGKDNYNVFIIEMVATNTEVFHYLSTDRKNNPSFNWDCLVENINNNSYRIFRYIEPRMIAKNLNDYINIINEIRNKKETDYILEYLPEELGKNQEFLLELVKRIKDNDDKLPKKHSFYYHVLWKSIDPELQENIDFIQKLVELDIRFFTPTWSLKSRPSWVSNRELIKKLAVKQPNIVLYLKLSDFFDMNQPESTLEKYIQLIEELYHINPQVLKTAFYKVIDFFPDIEKDWDKRCEAKKKVISHFVKLDSKNFDYYESNFDDLEKTTHPYVLEAEKRFNLDLVTTLVEIDEKIFFYIKGKKIFEDNDFLCSISQQPVFYQSIEKWADPKILEQAKKEILPWMLLDHRRDGKRIPKPILRKILSRLYVNIKTSQLNNNK